MPINEAGVAKLADAQVLGTCSRKGLEVQVLSPALIIHYFFSYVFRTTI